MTTLDTDLRFQRTTGLLPAQTLAALRQSHIVVAGVGGTGGQFAVDLARMGVGWLTLADFDVYEIHNMNRQIGCFQSTLGQSKIEVVAKMCRDINPVIQIHTIPEGVTSENAAELARAWDAFPSPLCIAEVIDLRGVQAKIDLHRECRRAGIMVITGIMTGLGATVISFDSDAPPYEDLFLTKDRRIDLYRLVPRVSTCFDPEVIRDCVAGRGHAPTCVVGATTASAMMISEIVRYLRFGKGGLTLWPHYLHADFYDYVYEKGCFPR